MADLAQERVTALWREAAARLAPAFALVYEHDCEVCELAAELADERTRSQELLAECGRLREQLAAAQQALAFWVERADHFEAALPPEKRYMRARGVLNANYAVGRAALGVVGDG